MTKTGTHDEEEDNRRAKLRRTPAEYLKDRVEYKTRNYVKKGTRYRYAYWIMAGIGAVGSSVVPVLVNIPVKPIYTTIVSLLVVVTVAMENLFHPREHWRNYDLISSELREEEMQFSTRSGLYSQFDKDKEEDAFHKFVERIENAIGKERAETIVMRTAVAPESNKNR